MMAAAGLTLMAWAWWAAPGGAVEKPMVVRSEARGAGPEKAGPVGLGDAASTASLEGPPDACFQEVMAEDTLPEPRPGQARPDANGRCPHKRQVSRSGGCWVQLSFDREECEAGGYVFTDRCYGPVMANPRQRQPTSSPGSQP